MNKSLWLGLWRFLFPVPRPVWQKEVAQNARRAQASRDFISADHHRVHHFVVAELPRTAQPLPAEAIAKRLQIPLERVKNILQELEEHMTFLFRNPQGEVAWAYPVTVDQTPHRITFSSGEKIYAA